MSAQIQSLPATAFVALGANLGEAQNTVRQAMQALGQLPATRLVHCSSLYLSEPVDCAEQQPAYVNAVAEVSTALAAEQLLQQLLQLEQHYGRQRAFHNAPRTLDLDLLLYGDMQMHVPGLTLPHPRMHERAFVLLPLLEIAPQAVIPGLGPAAACLTAPVAAQGIRRLGAAAARTEASHA